MLARGKGAGLDADDVRRSDAADRSRKAMLPWAPRVARIGQTMADVATIGLIQELRSRVDSRVA